MIADFQNKATGHWISIFKRSAKGFTADQRWFVVSVAAFTDSLSTILHNSRRSEAAGKVAGCLLLKDQWRPADSLPLEGDRHLDGVCALNEGNTFGHPVSPPYEFILSSRESCSASSEQRSIEYDKEPMWPSRSD